jgi:hypothetical protein
MNMLNETFNTNIDFGISYAHLERYPEMKYVIRNDTDQAIGVVGKDFNAATHPEFFGKIRDTWSSLLPELSGDVTISNKIARNGAWALEEVIFPKAKSIIETDNHATEIALRFIYWHGLDGSCRNNCLVGAIDFYCTNGMVSGDYNHIRRKNTKNFSMDNFIHEITNLEERYQEHVLWCQRLARRRITEQQIKDMLKGIIPSERTQAKMFSSVMEEVETRGWNMWAAYSAFTEYASHEDRFKLRQTGNDNSAERLHKRSLDVAKWTSTPEFMALAA